MPPCEGALWVSIRPQCPQMWKWNGMGLCLEDDLVDDREDRLMRKCVGSREMLRSPLRNRWTGMLCRILRKGVLALSWRRFPIGRSRVPDREGTRLFSGFSKLAYAIPGGFWHLSPARN